MQKGNEVLQLRQLQCQTARENRGSNLSRDGMFGRHLSKGRGEDEGDLQNKILNII